MTRRPAPGGRDASLIGKGAPSRHEIYTAVLTRTSLDQNYVFRILKNRETKDAEAFLSHPEKELYSFVFFRFEGIDGEFMTDARGRTLLGSPAYDLASVKVRLFPPSAVFRAEGPLADGAGTSKPVFSAMAEPELWIETDPARREGRTSLTVKVHPEAAARRVDRIALILGEKSVLTAAAIRGISIFEDLVDAENLQINLYE